MEARVVYRQHDLYQPPLLPPTTSAHSSALTNCTIKLDVRVFFKKVQTSSLHVKELRLRVKSAVHKLRLRFWSPTVLSFSHRAVRSSEHGVMPFQHLRGGIFFRVCTPIIGTWGAVELPSGYQPAMDKRYHHSGGCDPSLVRQVSCSSARCPCGPRRRRRSGCPRCRFHLQKN